MDDSAAQQIIDATYAFGRALRDDPVLRGSVRVSAEGHGVAREQRVVFDKWRAVGIGMIAQAIMDGDVAVQKPADAVDTLLASINGIFQASRTSCDYKDLQERLHAFWVIVAPGLFTANSLASLRLAPPAP